MARNPSTSSPATVLDPAACCARAGATANVKVMRGAPLTKSRRVATAVAVSSMAFCSRVAGRALHRAGHAQMRPAAAEIVSERLVERRYARILVLREQRDGPDDHAVEAIAALRRLFVDEGLLHRRWLVGTAEALERHDLSRSDRREFDLAGKHRFAVQQHHAGAALAKAEAEARSAQL